MTASAMKNLLTVGIAIAAIGAAPAFANVDPKIAEFCLKAQDFQGCVNSMSGGSTDSTTTIRQIQQEGASITEGNKCPHLYGYVGGGYCKRIICVKRGLFGRGHSQHLGGKESSCSGGAQLEWDNNSALVRASYDSSCPDAEPKLGSNSSCFGYYDVDNADKRQSAFCKQYKNAPWCN